MPTWDNYSLASHTLKHGCDVAEVKTGIRSQPQPGDYRTWADETVARPMHSFVAMKKMEDKYDYHDTARYDVDPALLTAIRTPDGSRFRTFFHGYRGIRNNTRELMTLTVGARRLLYEKWLANRIAAKGFINFNRP